MRRKNTKISVFIVTKNRPKELKRLLRSINNSANNIKTKIDIYLGIERGTYSKLKNFKNLVLKKIEFNKNTSPIYIKNFLYNLNPTKIKIFIDDDTEVKINFFFKILNIYKVKKNCFVKFLPLNKFTEKKGLFSSSNLLEFIGFAEIGSKKLNKLSELNFVAEDTETSNRINKKGFKIYQDSSIEIIHHISMKNRNNLRFEKNGIINTLEICRCYGAFKNFKIINDLIFKILLTILINRKFYLINIIINKLIFTEIGINYFYKNNVILPPYKNYFFNSNNLDKKKQLKKIKIKKYPEDIAVCRISTFENYQKIEKKIKKGIYIGPKKDKNNISSNYLFSDTNHTNDTFTNLLFYLNNYKFLETLIITFDASIMNKLSIYLKIMNLNFNRSLEFLDKIYLFNKNNFYKFDKKDYLKFTRLFSLVTFPIQIISFFLSIIMIMPLKLKKNINNDIIN